MTTNNRKIDNSNTISSHFLSVIKKGLASYGIDTDQLAKNADLFDKKSSNQDLRIKQHDIDIILNEAVKLTQDDAFAIKLINHTSPGGNLLTVLAGSCDSVQMLFGLASQRYNETYTNSVYATLEESTDVRLIFETFENTTKYPTYTIDFMLMYIVTFFKNLLDDPLSTPTTVKLTRKEPRNLVKFNKYFNCPIEFNADKNEICFDKRIYNLHNPLSNKALTSATKSIMEDQLIHVTKIPLSQRTTSYIKHQLPELVPRQEDWAKRLNISVRTLRRQLTIEKTCFHQILRGERVDLAKKFLKEHTFSVAEISTQLHFSDSSHFIKTFKQETGVTPKAYQANTRP
jgi:AraC-like DNA-binding protein